MTVLLVINEDWYKYSKLNMSLWYLSLSLPLLPVYLTFLACLLVYKSIIIAILKLKHGKNLTIITSNDSFFGLGKFRENLSNVLFTMNTEMSEEALRERMVQAINMKMIKYEQHFKKIHSSLYNFMGYTFLIKEDDVRATDFVTILDVEKDRYESINHLAYEYSMKPLPKQNKRLFEIIIIKSSKEWKTRNNFKVEKIPVLMRMHHLLADGLSTLNLNVQLFGDNKVVINEVVDKFNTNRKRPQYWLEILQNIYFFLLLPGYIIYHEIHTYGNYRGFMNNLGSGKQHFIYKVGDDNMMIRKIKTLKNKIGNCSFTQILITAISASIYEYSKKAGKIPISIETINAGVRYLKPMNENGLPILMNQFGYVIHEIPIDIKSDSLLRRIDAIKECTKISDIVKNFMIMKTLLCYTMGLLPNYFKKLFFQTNSAILAISNLPGIPKINFLDGIDVEEIYFFVLNRETDIGMGISIMTYDEKIHLGLQVYESIIPSQDDCRQILDNIFKTLNDIFTDFSDQNV
ncbi:uncharacterized protein LOC130895064 isoform X1 [Diorhabda carinulata]|uniref:uncharacterized protein LOC130895064 isoform X1 n=2 Tax=Diorhabda carinulata TaxID=1163345 RepID=UPI0025A0AE91|nr:uncharacterized protein LOC130895064 isoform X1 [Diorhabda carinulata]